MPRAKVIKLERGATAAARSALPAGIHPGRVELVTEGGARVRLTSGEVVSARLDDGLDDAFVEECLRDKRTVLLAASAGGDPVVLGALQTASTVARDRHDTLQVSAKRLQLQAEETISLTVGKSTLRFGKEGSVKFVAQKMTLDVAEVVRVLSALVELP